MNAVLTISNLVVNLRTDVINNKEFPSFTQTVCVRVCVCVLCGTFEERAIISACIINKLVFIIETRCVLYDVGTVFLYIIYTVFSLKYLSQPSGIGLSVNSKYTFPSNRRRVWNKTLILKRL
jgi:hypothetical protein